MDLIVRCGTVVDGTGAPRFRADVGVEAGRVVALGDLTDVDAAEVLDATRLIVAPGFVDVHSHSDFTLLADPRAQSSIFQGVTTEVIGNCGHGCAPIGAGGLDSGNTYGYLPGVEVAWRTTAGYLDALDAARPAVNVVPLVPNGNLRLAALGVVDRPATPNEVERMAELLEEGLAAGAFGFSTGLEYATERAATEAELTALCRVVARRGGIYTTHTRNREARAREAIEEAIRVAAAAEVPLQISHITPRPGGPPDALAAALEAVDRARARGVDVAFDMHTRRHGITNLSAALPSWALEGEPAALAARLRDPVIRKRLKQHESVITSLALAGWERVSLFRSERRSEWIGRSFAELAPPGGEPLDALLDVLLAECDDPHAPMVVALSYSEDELRATYRHPLCTIGSDATALAIDGPLAGQTFLGAFTWVALFFRRFVRELGDFTIEGAVQRLTATAADRFGLTDRGRLVAGAWADLVIFDPMLFGERGTLEEPNQLAEGVEHVVVNGEISLRDGTETGRRAGRVLRRNSP